MYKNSRFMATLLVSLALVACSSDDDSGSNQAVITGTASKGILNNARIRAYTFDLATNAISSVPIAETTTQEQGRYRLEIPSALRDVPLQLVLDDNDGQALMICDLPSGCEIDDDLLVDAAFGESVILSNGSLSLRASVPSADSVTQVNITPLSTVSSQLVADTLDVIADESALAVQIDSFNSAVSGRFGLDGLIINIPVADLTRSGSLASFQSDENALTFAAFNAALVEATQADGSALSLNEAIAEFVNQYAENGLSNNSRSESLTDYGDILDVADTVLDRALAQVPEGSNAALESTLASLSSQFMAQKALVDMATPSNVGSIGTPSETVDATRLAQSKAFVSELRDLSAAIDGSIISGSDPQQTVGSVKDTFEIQYDAADALSSEDVLQTLYAVRDAFAAVFEAFEINFDIHTAELKANDQGITPTLPLQETINDVTVSFSEGDDTLVANINQALSVDGYTGTIAVSLNVILDYNLRSQPTLDRLADATLDFQIDNASFTSDTTVMNISSGSISGERLKDEVAVESGEGFDSISTFEDVFTSVLINAQFSLEQTGQGIEGGAFRFSNAILNASFDRLNYRTKQNVATIIVTNPPSVTTELLDVILEELEFDQGDLTLSGTFANDANAFDMALSIDANGSNATFSQLNDNFWQESEDSFVSIPAATLMFDATLSGFQDLLTVSLTVARPEYDSGTIGVDLAYPGRTIRLDADIRDWDDATNQLLVDLDLSNNDGVIISAEGQEVGQSFDEISGSIRFADDSTIYAVFDRILIDYADGTFESLF